MAKLSGTVVVSTVVPTDTQDTHATHEDKYGKGGYRVVGSITDRNNITVPRRKSGMIVYVESEKEEYRLKDGIDNSNWVKIPKTSTGNVGEVEGESIKSTNVDEGKVLTSKGDGTSEWITPTGGSGGDVNLDEVFEEIGRKQDNLVSGETIKTINNESILGQGNLAIEQSIDASTLTEEQLDYLRDKQIKYGIWSVEQVAINLTVNQTKLPMFYTKNIGNLEPIDKYSFLCKAGKTYEISYSILAAMSAVGQYNFVIFDDIKNSGIWNTIISDYAGPTPGTQYRSNMNTTIFKFNIDTPISIRPYAAAGNITTMYGSRVSIKEISSFDVSLKDFKINGKSFDENNNIDLEGLSTLSSPKLNVEVLTEERHPVSGKPIYTKTIDFGALPNNTAKIVSFTSESIENSATVHELSYCYNPSVPNNLLPINYPHPTTLAGSWNTQCNKNQVFITTGMDRSTHNAIITVQYTKTTDTAESPVRLVGGGFKYVESDTEPDNPSLGDEWHNTTNDIIYKRRKKNGVLDWYEI